MVDTEGHRCPECGAPREPDDTPSCACGRRASDALRDARTAEQAAAEDFDPLRIRPYIDLDGARSEDPAEAPPGDPDATMTLRAVAAPVPVPAHVEAFEGRSGPALTAPTAVAVAGSGGETVRPRRRKAVLIAVGGVVVTVLAGAGFAGGLFSYDKPSRDTAMPDDIREAVPDASTTAPSATPGAVAESAAPASASPSAATSPSPSSSPSPSPSASGTASASASASGTPSAGPGRTTTAPTPPASPEGEPRQGGGGSGVVLERGDEGPEVVELQLRLAELNLFVGRTDGRFGRDLESAVSTYQWARGVRAEEWGVYDSATRVALEGETAEP
ncbi:peptidoglycan-binding protein [Streptomyces sp. NPDC056716]|uniref:peptidoglycan-binding domain-containing protein n=1 Tax=unclassified Streptomyces TaxID=2593676 RepID=UPI0036B42CE3